MTDIENGKGLNEAAKTQKENWVEPEMSVVDVVTATEGFPGVGGDGGINADCTLS